jgi:hypothetical protein
MVLYDPSATNYNGISETYVTEILEYDVTGANKVDILINFEGVGLTEPFPNVLINSFSNSYSNEQVNSKDFRP